ncbi:MAG TPA: hypothetical protein VI358_01185 [Pseudolabrys sp.]
MHQSLTIARLVGSVLDQHRHVGQPGESFALSELSYSKLFTIDGGIAALLCYFGSIRHNCSRSVRPRGVGRVYGGEGK